jgi:hypothetical protein
MLVAIEARCKRMAPGQVVCTGTKIISPFPHIPYMFTRPSNFTDKFLNVRNECAHGRACEPGILCVPKTGKAKEDQHEKFRRQGDQCKHLMSCLASSTMQILPRAWLLRKCASV